MSQVLDYSFARPNPTDIKNSGFVGVMRYLSYDGGKNLSAAELSALRAQGLSVGVVWETTASRVKSGAAGGNADAKEALRQRNTLGLSCPIYFGVDYDAPESDQAAINGYFSACASVIGKQNLGAYAGYYPLKRLFDANLITYGWQTLAWSGGNRDGRAHLYQNGSTFFNNSADVNDVLKSNWNGGTTVPTDALTKEEIQVIYQLAFVEGSDGSVPDGIVKAYTGKPLDGLLQQFQVDPTRLAIVKQYNSGGGSDVAKRLRDNLKEFLA